jgi:hypothetical protein
MMPQEAPPLGGPMELVNRQRFEAPPERRRLVPDDVQNNERDYGFRVYRDNDRGRSPVGEPLAPDFAGTTRGGYYADEPHSTVQGNSLRTWGNYGGSNTIDLRTDGRDMYANLEMWNGPDNTAQKASLYSQDGRNYGIRATMSTTQQNSIAVRNQGDLQFPLKASVTTQPFMGSFGEATSMPSRPMPSRRGRRDGMYGQQSQGKKIQGEGMVETFPIPAEVQSVRVVLESEGGNPINANMELLQGPNNAKVLGDIYNDGMHGPFEVEIDTPGMSSTLRITNTGPMSYPLVAYVEPLTFGEPRNIYNDNQRSRFGPDGRFQEW